MVTANENLLEQLKRNSDIIDKPITILFSQYEEVIRRLINPYFMDMYFHVKEPTLLLKAEKDGHIYHRCDMGELTFENR